MLTLLFTGIVLLIVVSTTASVVTGSLQGGASERQAYQALLAAESGLNALPRRAAEFVRTAPYAGTTHAELVSWVAGLQAQLQGTLPPDSAVTLTAVPGSADTFTARYQGASGGALKRIAQDYRITARTLPPGLRPRSGLISRPAITGNGSAKVLPQNVSGTVTTIAGAAPSLAALSPGLTLAVASSSGLAPGDYVRISGSTFRIDAVAGNTVTVARMPGPSATAQSLSGNVDLIFNAVAQSYSGVTPSTAVKISNINDFAVGHIVKVGTIKATVATIDYSTKMVTLNWDGAPPATLSEGTAVTRDTAALSSAGTISPKDNQLDYYQGVVGGVATPDCFKSGTTVTCAGANDPVLAAAGLTQTASSLSFTQLLLGLTDEELNDLVPTTSAPFPAMTGGILRVNASDFESAIKGRTSQGVLIIDGDIDANMNGNTTFNGLIYVRGNLIGFGNGNFTVNGSVAVRGTTGGVSNILGSLQINYNAVALRSVLNAATGSRQLSTVAGTWRQQ